MSRRLSVHVTHFVAHGRYNQQVIDTSGPAPRVIAGYSYPLPARKGQVDSIGIGENFLSTDDRSRCVIRNHRDSTTVNGVCLSCLQSRGHL